MKGSSEMRNFDLSDGKLGFRNHGQSQGKDSVQISRYSEKPLNPRILESLNPF